MKSLINKLHSLNLGEIKENEPLSRHTTYRVGGLAKVMVIPKDIKALQTLIRTLKEHNTDWFVLGNGSNVLISDKVFNSVVIKLNSFNHLEIKENEVLVGAGYSTIKLALETARLGLSGLEFASGIPGTIGGAIYMNSGAYKKEMKDIVEAVYILKPDGNMVWLMNEEMQFEYRSSLLKKEKGYICLEAKLHLKPGDKEEILSLIEDRRRRRFASQPLDMPSAGSVFKNPEHKAAWELIDECGLRGYKIGGAQISEKHANFVVNIGGAKAEDIKNLIDYAQEKVKKETGVELVREIEYVNW